MMLRGEIAAVFFDLGDTLGTPVLSPPPLHLISFDVFPFATAVLRDEKAADLRLGVISNTGDDDGVAVNHVLDSAGLLTYFETALLIYSKDVGLKKNSPAIFRLAAERAGYAAAPRSCLFVGEDAKERGFALDAGWVVCPHPLLVDEARAGQQLRYVRITVPRQNLATDWRSALRALPVVPLHTTGPDGSIVYAVTSQRLVPRLMDMRFGVELLGSPDDPLRTDLYILRDDVAAASGFLSTRGESSKFFTRDENTRLILCSTDEGIVVALPPERSLEEFHFDGARHGHTLKLMPDPSLLDPFRADDPLRTPTWLRPPAPGFAPPDLSADDVTELKKITGPVMMDRAERYGGLRPASATPGDTIASRHILHPGNARAVSLVSEELKSLGQGRLTVRLHQFTQAGRQLFNVEAELTGASPELVLVTAHLDSTAALSSPYDAEHDPAPGVDDDASGMAAVVTIAERFAQLAGTVTPARTLRFVLFNAEEHGLVGSKAYARQQKLMNAPIVAVFQMDMIGYNKVAPRAWEVHVGYSASSDVESRSLQLAKLVSKLSTSVSPLLEAPQIYTSDLPDGDPAEGRSDHGPFHACGYAACVSSEDYFVGPDSSSPSPEENPKYHSKEDTFIDADFAADIARALAAAAWVTAKTASTAPGFAPATPKPTPSSYPPANKPTTPAPSFAPPTPVRGIPKMQRELDTRRVNAKLFGKAAPQDSSTAGSFALEALSAKQKNAITSTSVTVPAPALAAPERSLVEKAMTFVQQQRNNLGFGAADPVEFVPDPTVQVTSVGAAAVHLQQFYRGLPVFQMSRTVRFSPGGQPTDASGDSAPIAPGFDTEPKLNVLQAVLKAAEHIEATSGEVHKDRFGGTYKLPGISVKDYHPEVMGGFPLVTRPTLVTKGPFENPIPAYLLVFYNTGPRLAWHVTLTMPKNEDGYVVIVSADEKAGEVLYSKSTVDSALARGNVYEFNPQDTPRRLIDFPRPVTDYPAMPNSPLTGFPADWIALDQTTGNSTRATLGTSTTTLPGVTHGGPVEFNPTNDTGDEQKILNIFYFCNYMHDFLYLVGFDEAAGNFQDVNFTNTGLGQDPVRARAHSGAVTGVANMSTPPDGLPPLMNMGLYTPSGRHTAFDADVVLHEYTHGLTNRIVGGRVNSHALDAAQSSGMGEGWSDFYALTVQNYFRSPNPEKVVTGAWVTNMPGGIRSAPYDENYPLKYGDIVNLSDEHDIGEIWCAALMQMTRNIRKALGSDRDGYRLAWTIVTDGLKLTHANPSCIDARDAILRALDDLKTAGRLSPSVYTAVRRACWQGFARFGMGFQASSDGPGLDNVVADESLPPGV